MSEIDALADPIYRNPPVIRGLEYASAEDLGEIIDWGLKNQSVQEIHKITKGAGIKIAVLDTGAPQHQDIGELLFAHNTTNSATPFDGEGHSTHVCGIIRARANDLGVRGVAPEAMLGTVKVLGDNGSGMSKWISNGIYKAIDEKVDILSMSLGGGYSQPIEQACIDAVQSGMFVICAAGNEGSLPGQNTVNWPARLAVTIAVASYNQEGQISEFSSSGPEVAFAFPGEDILSTWPGNRYRRLSGTSMATPFMSGTVALYLAYLKTVGKPVPQNNSELREQFKAACKDMGPTGRDDHWGWGIPDLNGLVRAIDVRPPSDPNDLFLGPFGFRFPTTLEGKQGVFIYIK
jgi:subtilisin family serine protease